MASLNASLVFEVSQLQQINNPLWLNSLGLSAHLSAYFPVPTPLLLLCALVFKNRPCWADHFPAAPGFVGSCLCGSDRGWKAPSRPLCFVFFPRVPAPPLAQQPCVCGGRGGCIIIPQTHTLGLNAGLLPYNVYNAGVINGEFSMNKL